MRVARVALVILFMASGTLLGTLVGFGCFGYFSSFHGDYPILEQLVMGAGTASGAIAGLYLAYKELPPTPKTDQIPGLGRK